MAPSQQLEVFQMFLPFSSTSQTQALSDGHCQQLPHPKTHLEQDICGHGETMGDNGLFIGGLALPTV